MSDLWLGACAGFITGIAFMALLLFFIGNPNG